MRVLATIGCSLAITLTVPVPSRAADETAEKVSACSGIASDLYRLDCFDQLARYLKGPGPAAAVVATVEETYKWSFQDSRSPIDDSPQIVATKVVPDGKLNSWSLIIQCRDHKTGFYVATTQYLGLAEDHVKAVYRVADLPPVEQNWTGGGGTSAYVPGDAAKFIRSLPDSGRFFIRLIGYNGTSHDMTFALDGLQEVRNKVGKACNWSAH